MDTKWTMVGLGTLCQPLRGHLRFFKTNPSILLGCWSEAESWRPLKPSMISHSAPRLLGLLLLAWEDWLWPARSRPEGVDLTGERPLSLFDSADKLQKRTTKQPRQH